MNEAGVAPIRCHDESGRLVAAGVDWTEYRVGFIWLVAVPAALLLLPLTPLFVGMLATGFATGLTALFIANVVSVGALIWVANRSGVRTRSAVFHADGTISVPQGLPVQPRIKALSFPHTEVTSIEQMQAGQIAKDVPVSFIDVFGREGDHVTLGHNLRPQVCHRAVVQLTKALAEIREAIARPAHRYTSQAATADMRSPGETMNVVID